MTMPIDAAGAPAIKKNITLKVFGLGGAGCNAAGFAASAGFEGVEFMAINTDAQALDACMAPSKFVLGAQRARGLGAGGDPELGRAAAQEDIDKLKGFCAGADIVFVLAGLGGGTGTGAGPVLARTARDAGALVLGLVTMPFDFEGNRRNLQAQVGLQQFKSAADAVICLPNQKLFKLLDEKTSVLEAFKISNGFLTEGMRGIWRLLTQTGLINVDFADLCAVTRGRHAVSSFATADAAGDKRAELAVEKLLAHPLLDGGQVLTEADSALVSIVGGPDLTMNEIHKLMEPVKRQAENANIIFGAMIDNSFAGRLSLTLIASSHRGNDGAATPEPGKSDALQFLDPAVSERPASRFVPPAPELPADKKEQLLKGQGGRGRKKLSRLQKELPLEIVFKGRFDKSEPTIRHGEDLDVPTYIRRGVPLN